MKRDDRPTPVVHYDRNAYRGLSGIWVQCRAVSSDCTSDWSLVTCDNCRSHR